MTEAIEIQIRDARPDELEAVRHLTLNVYAEYEKVMEPRAWSGLSEAVKGALANQTEGIDRIVAVRDAEVVGSVLLFPPASDAYRGAAAPLSAPELRLLAVRDDQRGQGIGRKLVEECIRRARERGAEAVGLHTSRSMAAAIKLYESMGFERFPDEDFQTEGSELVTAYRLPLNRAATL